MGAGGCERKLVTANAKVACRGNDVALIRGELAPAR